MRDRATRPPPLLLAGAVALDVLNSIASPHGEPVEWIGDGSELVDWLIAAGLVEAGAVRALLRRDRRGELDRAAAEVRRLREWFRDLAKRCAGAPLPRLNAQELQPLNAALAAESVSRRIEPSTEPRASRASSLGVSRGRLSPALLYLPMWRKSAVIRSLSSAAFR